MHGPWSDRRGFLVATAAATLAASGSAAAAPVGLAPELDRICRRWGLPGAVAMVLRGGVVVAQGAAGVRSVTQRGAVRLGDRFMLGSCGKSMTATIAARLAARGLVPLATTLAQAFPGVAMQPAYRAVTLEMLLAHRSALPQVPPLPLPLDGDPATARARALPVILALPPAGTPGQTYRYSNLGYIVAGTLLERRTGVTFETHAVRELFQPLALASAGFGAPRGAEAPRGHTAFGLPLPPDSPLYPPAGASPAGLIHLALPGWATYARLHLGVGSAAYLPAAMLARLQRPWGGVLPGYALGWHVRAGTWGRELRHNGSDGYWAARIRLVPSRGYAILMATNILSPNTERAADELEATLLRHFPPA